MTDRTGGIGTPLNPTVLKGVLLMAAYAAAMAAMHATVRYSSTELHPFVIAFFRNLLSLPMVLPLVLRHGRAGLRPKRFDLHLWRAVIGAAAMLAWFYALSVLPLANATALSFTTALFVTIFAALFIGEQVGLRRGAAVIIGFVGTVIILRPGLEVVSIGAVLAVVSSATWGIALVVIKTLSRYDRTESIVFWASVLLTPLTFVAALFVWQWPTWEQLGVLALLALFSTIAHVLMTEAFKNAEAVVVMPLDFTRLIWAAVIGYVLFLEVPDWGTWLGGTVIFASATYITWREHQLEQQRKAAIAAAGAPPPAAP